jgi:hypothetical protein
MYTHALIHVYTVDKGSAYPSKNQHPNPMGMMAWLSPRNTPGGKSKGSSSSIKIFDYGLQQKKLDFGSTTPKQSDFNPNKPSSVSNTFSAATALRSFTSKAARLSSVNVTAIKTIKVEADNENVPSEGTSTGPPQSMSVASSEASQNMEVPARSACLEPKSRRGSIKSISRTLKKKDSFTLEIPARKASLVDGPRSPPRASTSAPTVSRTALLTVMVPRSPETSSRRTALLHYRDLFIFPFLSLLLSFVSCLRA